jgi:hypothetical protein
MNFDEIKFQKTMKKSLIFACCLGVSTFAQAQLQSKKGEAYLPEKGDWSLGIDATPFLDYMGNFLSSGGNSAPTQNFLGANQTIIGKYFTEDNKAYRGILRIGVNSNSEINQISKHGSTAPTYPDLPELVDDKYTEKSSFIGLGGGLEFRRGKTRLQGYYGGDAMISFSSSSRSFEYGNALNDSTSVGALTSDFGDEGTLNIISDTYGNTGRITTQNDGSMFALTLRGFAGVEYFVLPKLSIAGEFGWGVTFASMGGSSTELESVDFGGNNPEGTVTIGTQTIENPKTSGFRLDTDRNLTGSASGALRLNFHF